jgi:MerR family copper efflux transcriptional regulator
MTVSEAADQTGWSPRMLRYIERAGLVVPERSESGYRLYSLRELNQLRTLAALRQSFGVEISDVAFAARLHEDPALNGAIETWLAGQPAQAGSPSPAWVEWEQRKQERLLAA